MDSKKLDSRFFRNVVRWYSMKINHGIDDNRYVGHRGVLSQLDTHTMENAFYLQFANIHIYIIFFTRSIEPRGGK